MTCGSIERRKDDLPLDGQNILPALRGEPHRTLTRRFWQWNRYTPNITCNAAMRDGRYKLVRPGIEELMRTLPEDGRMDDGAPGDHKHRAIRRLLHLVAADARQRLAA